MQSCNGGDGRLDIYLVDMAVMGQVSTNLGETTSNIALTRKHAPTFILLSRALSTKDLLGAAAHEFAHSCQWAYDVKAFSLSSYGWLMESTAQEAIDHYDAANNLEQGLSKLRAYLDSPANPIHEGDAKRRYGSYLFFQYLARASKPSLIGTIWAQTVSESDPIKAVEVGLTKPGLKDHWARYARTLWNQDPVDSQPASFAQWDTMAEAPLFRTLSGDLGGASAGDLDLSHTAEAKPMSVRFTEITFTDVPTSSLMFHNTFYDVQKAGEPISVQAFYLNDSGQWQEEDWTKFEWIGFCRDQKDQRLTKLILVVASAKTGAPLRATGPLVLKRNNLPCWGFEGAGRRVTKDPQWSSGQVAHELTGKWGGHRAGQYVDVATGKLRVPIAAPLFQSGSSVFSEDYVENGCTHRASSSRSVTSVAVGGTTASSFVINYFFEALPQDLAVDQADLIGEVDRNYQGNGQDSLLLMGTVSGGTQCSGTYQTTPATFLMTQLDTASSGAAVKQAAANGELTGTLVDSASHSTYTWSFTRLREP